MSARTAPFRADASLHASDGAAVDLPDAFDAGQRHGDVEFVADDLDGAGDTRLPAGAEAVNVGPAAQAGLRAERERAEKILPGADAAIEHDLDIGPERVGDPRQHGDRRRRAVELAAAVIGDDQ